MNWWGQMGIVISQTELSHAVESQEICPWVCTFFSYALYFFLSELPSHCGKFVFLVEQTYTAQKAYRQKNKNKKKSLVQIQSYYLWRHLVSFHHFLQEQANMAGRAPLGPGLLLCYSLRSLLSFIHKLSHLHYLSTLSLLCLLFLLQIAHILVSSLTLSFSLPKLPSFRSSQQCPSCYHVHLLTYLYDLSVPFSFGFM